MGTVPFIFLDLLDNDTAASIVENLDLQALVRLGRASKATRQRVDELTGTGTFELLAQCGHLSLGPVNRKCAKAALRLSNGDFSKLRFERLRGKLTVAAVVDALRANGGFVRVHAVLSVVAVHEYHLCIQKAKRSTELARRIQCIDDEFAASVIMKHDSYVDWCQFLADVAKHATEWQIAKIKPPEQVTSFFTRSSKQSELPTVWDMIVSHHAKVVTFMEREAYVSAFFSSRDEKVPTAWEWHVWQCKMWTTPGETRAFEELVDVFDIADKKRVKERDERVQCELRYPLFM